MPAWKQDADFLFVQAGFDIEALLRWREGLHFAGPVYAGVLVVASPAMAKNIQAATVEIERWHEFHEAVNALPVEEREVFNLRFYQGWKEKEIAGLLRRARMELPGTEALVLSTCNRTEFYLDADDAGPWHELLKRVRPDAPATPEDCHFHERRGADAFRHLARVACGLESAILGAGSCCHSCGRR